MFFLLSALFGGEMAMKGKKAHFDFPTLVISVAGGVIGCILAQKYFISRLSAKYEKAVHIRK